MNLPLLDSLTKESAESKEIVILMCDSLWDKIVSFCPLVHADQTHSWSRGQKSSIRAQIFRFFGTFAAWNGLKLA